MIFEGIKLVAGSEVQNLVVDNNTALPPVGVVGELFYCTQPAIVGFYVCKTASTGSTPAVWEKQLGASAVVASLPDVIVPGSYQSVTVNSKGLIAAGVNPTTLAGFGITDAQPLDEDLSAIAALPGNVGFLRKDSFNTWSLDTNTYLVGNQTITLTGDAGGAGTITIPVTLSATGVGAGTYGSASMSPSLQIDSKGRIVAAVDIPVAIDASQVATGAFADARISQSSVAQYQTALVIAESQITDGTIFARIAGNETITGIWSYDTPVTGQTPTIAAHLATKQYVDDAEAAAIAAAAAGNSSTATALQTARNFSIMGDVSAPIISFNGTGDVALSSTLAAVGSSGVKGSASAVPVFTTDTKGRVTANTDTPIAIGASQVISGTFADARISSSNVTQYQTALVVAESQITNGTLLARVADNETVTGTWTFTNPVTGVDPSVASQLATKQYVDNAVLGLIWKHPVEVATTANITLSGLQVVDGYALVTGDRILVKNQTITSQNGIYDVSAGAWTRTTDFDQVSPIDEVNSAAVFVRFGTTQTDTGWTQTSKIVTVGADPITFVQFSAANSFVAGNGLTLTGNTFNVNTASASRIVVGLDDIDLAQILNSGTGAFSKFYSDNYGRVTGTTPVNVSDISAIVDTRYVLKAGDTMTGALTATAFIGDGSGLTNLPNSAFNNSTITIGTTNITLGGTAPSLTGLISVDASSFTGYLNGAASLNLLKTGDTMTGTLGINFGGGTPSSTPSINALNGSSGLVVVSQDTTSGWNTLAQSGDTVIVSKSATVADGGAGLVLGLWSASAKGLRINPNGNISIGKATAATTLDVAGTVTATTFAGAGTSLTGTAAGLSIGGSASTITGVYGGTLTSLQITTGLGFTPYNSTNPSGYTANLGTVTAVSGVGPISSTGGTTPAISIAQATTSTSGYLSSADWNTFNGKQAALGFTPYNATNPNNYISGLAGSALTGTSLATTIVSSNLTSVGTLGALTVSGNITNRGGRVTVVNPTTPLDGDMQVVGSVISIYAGGAWRQIFPAVYS